MVQHAGLVRLRQGLPRKHVIHFLRTYLCRGRKSSLSASLGGQCAWRSTSPATLRRCGGRGGRQHYAVQ